MAKKDIPIRERVNYLIDARFIKSTRIIEYDIQQSNISILRQAGVISDEEFRKLASWPKSERERDIGLMIRTNPVVSDILKQGVIDSKVNLFEANDIKDQEVVRIANDAVYIMRAVPLKYTDFGGIRFLLKNVYSLFARIHDLIFFFNIDHEDINMDVIGLGRDQMELHRRYMLEFIGNLFYLMETNTVSYTVQYFMDFYHQYLNRELPVEFYRELNSDSLYCIRSNTGVIYGSTDCTEEEKYMLEIGYNAQVLRELYGIITEIHDMGL